MAASKSSEEEVTNDQDVAFMANMGKVMEHNALGISIAIGYRVGLIEVLANLDEPKTSMEIADKAGHSCYAYCSRGNEDSEYFAF